MLTIDRMLAAAEDAASMALYKCGTVEAMIILHAKEGVFALPYKQGHPERVPFEQKVITTIVKSCYAAGSFEGLLMLSESWFAKEVKGDNRMPSERPDKEERVVAAIWDRNLNKVMALYPIIRNEKKVLLGARIKSDEPTEFHSWLDDSFK